MNNSLQKSAIVPSAMRSNMLSHRWQDSSAVECLPKDLEVCGPSLHYVILLWGELFTYN